VGTSSDRLRVRDGRCTATTSGNDPQIVRGNAGDVLDARSREASTLRFSIELTGTADSSATLTEVTVTWS
jgi:hypothetical protein